MSNTNTSQVKDCLTKMDVHEQWENDYRGQANAEFYDLAFETLTELLSPSDENTIVDVGCGIGAHSSRLAERGFSVLGIDFSDAILEQAVERAKSIGLDDKMQFAQQDILDLTLADNSYDFILCWGVLMHIPDVERAISELKRILKPGGKIVISEGNMHSLQSRCMRILKTISGKGDGTPKFTPQGFETWTSGSAGTHVTRQANINWLLDNFENDSFSLDKRLPGQFTELYTRVRSPILLSIIHKINSIYFQLGFAPSLAQGNILIFKKNN